MGPTAFAAYSISIQRGRNLKTARQCKEPVDKTILEGGKSNARLAQRFSTFGGPSRAVDLPSLGSKVDVSYRILSPRASVNFQSKSKYKSEMSSVSKTVPGQLYSITRSPQSIAFPTTSPLVCFEHAPPQASDDGVKNTLIFLGGLTDGLLTTPFVTPIAAALPSSWRLVEPVLGSNYRQFGFSSLDQDVAEIEVVVQFFRDLRPGGKIALLGHSTGSQMVMHYLVSNERKSRDGEPRPKIDAGMMQGSASDREALEMFVSPEDMEAVVKQANEYVSKAKANDILPWKLTNNLFPGVPLSADRLLSLTSPGPAHKGQDDYFSSDLSDERLLATFGRLGQTETRICFLYGEEDQYVPGDIDKAALVEKWHRIAREGGAVVDEESGVVAGATHTLRGQTAPLELLVQKVVSLLGRL